MEVNPHQVFLSLSLPFRLRLTYPGTAWKADVINTVIAKTQKR